MIKLKRGEATWGIAKLMGLILIAAGVIFLFIFTGPIGAYFKAGGDSAACTLSLTGGTAKCPIDDVIIYDDRVEIKKEGKTKYEKFMEKGSRPPDEMAKDALAKLLQACLNRGGGYNSRAFKRDHFITKTEVCLECFSLVIDNSIDNKLGSFTGLRKYLEDNTPKGTNSAETYMEILTKDSSHRKTYLEYGSQERLFPYESTKDQPPRTFDPGIDYTIFFLGIKKGSASKKYHTIKAALEGNIVEAVLGNSDTYFTFISDSAAFIETCERKVN